ncbi:hypothetical protein GV054_17550 [Marinomonas mediterranea]|uniref:hypothetical protein n=1 Tax=Marinomonas mediterranea TaxID=119864 RepID=UPI00234A4AE3|nr:hypothetical protein [Marinomonas mediterranea]WCN14682.1 hypothetical protein GV054_17550 [Marinomonas mediterranea]
MEESLYIRPESALWIIILLIIFPVLCALFFSKILKKNLVKSVVSTLLICLFFTAIFIHNINSSFTSLTEGVLTLKGPFNKYSWTILTSEINDIKYFEKTPSHLKGAVKKNGILIKGLKIGYFSNKGIVTRYLYLGGSFCIVKSKKIDYIFSCKRQTFKKYLEEIDNEKNREKS